MPQCQLCKQQATKPDIIKYHDKNYHIKCCELVKEKEEFWTYACKILGLKQPGPTNYKMAANFFADGISYPQMLMAFKYFYEVKNNPVEKAQRRIGIVPYVYQEAEEYFSKLDRISDGARELKEVQMNERKIKFDSMPRKRNIITPIDIDEVAHGNSN